MANVLVVWDALLGVLSPLGWLACFGSKRFWLFVFVFGLFGWLRYRAAKSEIYQKYFCITFVKYLHLIFRTSISIWYFNHHLIFCRLAKLSILDLTTTIILAFSFKQLRFTLFGTLTRSTFGAFNIVLNLVCGCFGFSSISMLLSLFGRNTVMKSMTRYVRTEYTDNFTIINKSFILGSSFHDQSYKT